MHETGDMRERKFIGAASALLVAAAVLAYGVGTWPFRPLQAPPPTLMILDRIGRPLCEFPSAGGSGEEARGFWPVRHPPAKIALATLAAEDKRFFSHPGVDPLALIRALLQNIRRGRIVSGASTIPMQIARMHAARRKRSLAAKTMEGIQAVLLCLFHPKEELLAHYLTIAPYGNNVHGVEYAARFYFRKPARDLSWAESALLAALPKAPGRYDPFTRRGMRRAVRRAGRILSRAFRCGFLGRGELARARHELERLGRTRLRRARRPLDSLHLVLKLRRMARRAGLDKTGRPVRTSVDLDVQHELAGICRKWSALLEDKGRPNCAMVAVDLRRHAWIGYVGSSDYFDEERDGSIDYAAIVRSSGSTLKPFLFALAMDMKVLSPASIIDDLPLLPHLIRNSDGQYLGPLLPRKALANSRNVPAVRVLMRCGLERFHELLMKLGVHDGSRPASHYGIGMAIGTLETSLERLAAAYCVLADNGWKHELTWFVRARNRQADGKRPEKVLSTLNTRRICSFLSDPGARLPTFPRMGNLEYPFDVAVKTGTSQDYRDAWCVAFSRRFLAACWIGRPDWRPMHHVNGYNSAAAMVKEAMLWLHRTWAPTPDGREERFPPPPGCRLVAICPLTGELAPPGGGFSVQEALLPEETPRDYSMVRVSMPFASKLPGYGGTTELLDLPPRYRQWAHRRGMRLLCDLTGMPAGSGAAEAWRGDGSVEAPRILRPLDGTVLISDPDEGLPPIVLQAVGGDPYIDWYVDSVFRGRTCSGQTLEWKPSRGRHVFEARSGGGRNRDRAVVWVY